MTLKIEGDKMGGFHMLRKNVSAGKVNFIVFIIFVFILNEKKIQKYLFNDKFIFFIY